MFERWPYNEYLKEAFWKKLDRIRTCSEKDRTLNIKVFFNKSVNESENVRKEDRAMNIKKNFFQKDVERI